MIVPTNDPKNEKGVKNFLFHETERKPRNLLIFVVIRKVQ